MLGENWVVHMQRLQRQQRHLSRQRQMQAVAPRLEILQNMPFFIPFETRVHIFREFVALDKVSYPNRMTNSDWQANRLREAVNPMRLDPMMRMVDFMAGAGMDPRRSHHARIRRSHIIDDAYDQFNSLGEGLKDPIQITFVDTFNQDEAGIDGGGVTKEFLTSITKEMFTPSNKLQLFVENEQHLQYPNPVAMDEYKEMLVRHQHLPEGTEEHRRRVSLFLSRYKFLGRIIGKCLYEGILVAVAFAGFFLLKWALTGGNGSAPRESGYRANINDLRELDEALYQGLVSSKALIETPLTEAAQTEKLPRRRPRTLASTSPSPTPSPPTGGRARRAPSRASSPGGAHIARHQRQPPRVRDVRGAPPAAGAALPPDGGVPAGAGQHGAAVVAQHVQPGGAADAHRRHEREHRPRRPAPQHAVRGHVRDRRRRRGAPDREDVLADHGGVGRAGRGGRCSSSSLARRGRRCWGSRRCGRASASGTRGGTRRGCRARARASIC